MQCAGCKFWDAENRWGQEKDKARCRYNAPTWQIGTGNETASWPSTYRHDWCGRFEPRPNK